MELVNENVYTSHRAHRSGCRLRSAARRGSTEEWNRRDPQSPQSIWWHTDATFVGFRIVRAVDEQENLKGVRSRITTSSR